MQKLDDGDLPDPKYLWKEFCAAMRAVDGHNSRTRPTVDKYWTTDGGALEWPKKAIFSIPESSKGLLSCMPGSPFTMKYVLSEFSFNYQINPTLEIICIYCTSHTFCYDGHMLG